METKDYDAVLNLDLRGTFLCCREAVKVMKGNGGGAIINISSQGGRVWSELSGPHYAAAKAGVLGLTRQLAREKADAGLRSARSFRDASGRCSGRCLSRIRRCGVHHRGHH